MIYLVYNSLGDFYMQDLLPTDNFWYAKINNTHEEALEFIEQLKKKHNLTRKYFIMSVEENV